MKNTLSTYGWITVIIVILFILLSAATPAGEGLMKQMFKGTNKLTEEAVKQGLVSPNNIHEIIIEKNPNNILSIIKNTGVAGETIEVTYNDDIFYYCENLEIEYNGVIDITKGLTFKMPDSDVIIRPVIKDLPYSKIYFKEDQTNAIRSAELVGDSEFTSRAPIQIDGCNYYIVHDNSNILGYNDNLKINAYQNTPSISRVILGNSCSEIAKSAFYNDVNLKEVSLSQSLNKIGRAAFENCVSLENLYFKEGVSEIEESAFYNCNMLGQNSTLKLPNSVTVVKGSAFSYTKYNNLEYSYNLNTVGNYAFFGTQIPEDLIFPEHVRNLEENSTKVK